MSELYPVPSPTASNENPTNETPKQINLLDIDVVDENSALNVLVGFIGLAQKRGVFAINESAKIYECIKKFKK
jgi:hypothetical protein